MAEEDEEKAGSGHQAGHRGGPTAADASAQLLEANRRLRESAQHRDDLLSLAAADLRGPAAALLRHVRRLRRGEAALSQRDRRSLESMERQAGRVAALSDGLGALKTFEGGKVQLHREPVDLGALLARVADGRTPAAAARGVQLVRALPAEPVTLTADASRLEQVMGTLLDSAIAATARGGRVRLALEVSADAARITVEDGRAEAQAARRAALRGTAGRLSGLGLAVCRSVAELHGGALEMALRGGRLVAEITLPASPRPAPLEPLPAGSAWQRARVLVVDDDVDAREALSMMLGDDYDVVLAGDGREALDAAVVCRPDVVLMDFYMPRMDGLAALEALRLEPATADVPVILISGRGDEIVRSRSIDQGAVDFLQKPFSGRELKSRMERTLRLTRRETQLQALARTDPLTGLANVRAFRARLDEEVKRALRYRTALACVMVDMDHLKPINDALGHGAGDAAIAAVAEVLRRELRETDFGARYGGDEFVMLLPHTSSLEARAFAERVRVRLGESPLEVRGHVLPLHASFGISALGDEPLAEAGELLVRRADAALYAAKRGGRGRVAAHPSIEPDEDEDEPAATAPAPS